MSTNIKDKSINIKDRIMCILFSVSTGSMVFVLFIIAVILMGVEPITQQELIAGIAIMAICLITMIATIYIQYRYLEIKEHTKVKKEFIVLNAFIEIFTAGYWLLCIMQY